MCKCSYTELCCAQDWADLITWMNLTWRLQVKEKNLGCGVTWPYQTFVSAPHLCCRKWKKVLYVVSLSPNSVFTVTVCTKGHSIHSVTFHKITSKCFMRITFHVRLHAKYKVKPEKGVCCTQKPRFIFSVDSSSILCVTLNITCN